MLSTLLLSIYLHHSVKLLAFLRTVSFFFFFFNDTATTEIYTLSLHDALPISSIRSICATWASATRWCCSTAAAWRSEEHTSELQSRPHLVCRLLLEKKKENNNVQMLGLNEKKSFFVALYNMQR